MDIEYGKWYDVSICWIKPSSLQVSPDGKIKDIRGIHNPEYLSTNGYMYVSVTIEDGRVVLKPFDIIMALTFVAIPDDLIGKNLKVRHKNGILANCDYQNLEWEENVEEWKPIEYRGIRPGYYEVSNLGRIRTLSTNPSTIMKTEISSRGYERIMLMTNVQGSHKHYSVHRLVAYAFVPGYRDDKQVNHISGDKLDNNCLNLEWITQSANIQHAFATGLNGRGDNSTCSRITESDAVTICQSLNKNHGCIMDTYNELRNSIPALTYPIVWSIKYGDTFTYISGNILTNDGRRKQIRQTDPDVILDVAQCLKRHNGDVKKTKKALTSKYPWISYSWLWHLKDKSVGSEVTDLVFAKDEFPKTIPLTEDNVMMIINSLLSHVGDPYINQTVFDELKDKIPGLTKDKVRAIKEKKSWKTLSDKYFEKSLFI